MTKSVGEGIGYVASGTALGAGLSAAIGKMGLVGKFGGISIGMIPVAVVGGVTGAAAYGAFQAIQERDATAIGAIGLGTVGGIGVSGVVGGMGLGLGGIGIGIGMLPLSIAGGVAGLGIYGLTKLFTNGNLEKKIYQNLLFLEQMTQDYEQEQFWSDLEVEQELEALKAEIGFKPNPEQKEFLLMLFVSIPEEDGKKPSKLFYEQQELETLLNDLKEKIDENFTSDKLPLKNEIENLWKALQDQGVKPNDFTEEIIPNHPIDYSWQCGQIIQAHQAKIKAIAISPDGQNLISGSLDKTIKLWNLKTEHPSYTFFGLAEEVQTIAFSPDGEMIIAAGFDQRISAWKLPSKQIFSGFFSPNSYKSHEGAIFSVVFTGDRKSLISASGDGTIRVWGGFTGQLKRTLKGHSDIIWSLAVTSDGQTLVSGSADKTIGLWQLESYHPIRFLQGHLGGVTAVALSPDGKILISGSIDTTVKFWHLSTGELIKTLTGHTATVESFAISPDGETLASASLKEVLLWNLSTQELIKNLSGCSPIVFSPDGKVLISGGYGNFIKVWYPTVMREQLTTNFVDGEWWEVLRVGKNATAKEVKDAYRNLARRYHPDLNYNEKAIAKMQIINKAYEQYLKWVTVD